MRRICLGMLVGVLFLAGCEAAPPRPITALDQADFVNVGTGDRLHLGLRGRYTMVWREKPGDRVESGGWNLLSAEGQVVTLDGKITVRLMHLPGEKVAYQFRVIELYANSTIPVGELDQFERLSGQWFARKADLQARGGEGSLSHFLEPGAAGRGEGRTRTED